MGIRVTYPCWHEPKPAGSGSVYQVFPLKLLCFPSFSYHTLWEEVTITSAHVRMEYLYPLFEFFFIPFTCLFNYLFTSIWIDAFMKNVFYTLGYNPMLIILFCYSNCSRIGNCKLFPLTLMSPLHTYITFFSLRTTLFPCPARWFRLNLYISCPGNQDNIMGRPWEKRVLGFHKASSGLRFLDTFQIIPLSPSELDKWEQTGGGGDDLSEPISLVRK